MRRQTKVASTLALGAALAAVMHGCESFDKTMDSVDRANTTAERVDRTADRTERNVERAGDRVGD